ncbi:NUC169 domain-containing protein [Phlyctochytrium arcticum]|nr:NUC169 domain-containing protein [Phlyctochytrium arcticum]
MKRTRAVKAVKEVKRKPHPPPLPIIDSSDAEEFELPDIVDNEDLESDGEGSSGGEEHDGINSDDGEGDEDATADAADDSSDASPGDEELASDDDVDFGDEEDDEEDDEDGLQDDESGSGGSGTDDDEALTGSGLRVLRRKARPEIDPIYAEDDSDEEVTNTIGNVPKEWYDDLPHMGYDINGKPIAKSEKGDQLDQFLATMDDPDAWRSVYDKLEERNIVLTTEELQMLKKIQKGYFPDEASNPYEPTVEWFSSQTSIMPLSAAPEPKRRFIPSKHEARKIMHIVRAIRQGRIIPGKKQPKKQNEVFDIWADAPEQSADRVMHISAPKLALPEHDESYNPPVEYLPDEKEIEEWKNTDTQDREKNYVPKKYGALRLVPGYDRFIQERFERCLDLYLCPRMIKKRLQVDPESLIPKLPSPRDLEPFPSKLAITYKGHQARVRMISVDPSGQFLASASDDKTVRLWDVATGRCLKKWSFAEAATSIAWNPNKTVCLLAVSVQSHVYLINPETAPKEVTTATDALMNHMWTLQMQKGQLDSGENAAKNADWGRPSAKELASGHRVHIRVAKAVTYLTWHRKGDYFATVSPNGESRAVLIHQVSRGVSQSPFKRNKGLVQRVVFHPLKPLFFVATQRYVRVYNLQTQTLAKTLQPSTKWISSLSIHPAGDNLIVGTFDKRLCWFDMDLSTKPYKTLRYHKQAIRNVVYHPRYPLFASCADDGQVNIFHGMVYNDLMMNPLIVPVKTLKAHSVKDSLGALHCEFHPSQPWIFSSGADSSIKLFT